jgi:hypothetical protein
LCFNRQLNPFSFIPDSKIQQYEEIERKLNDLKSQSIKICLNNQQSFENTVSNLLQTESDQNIIEVNDYEIDSISKEHSSSRNESNPEDSQSETETEPVRPSTSKQANLPKRKSFSRAVSAIQSNANQTLRSESNQNQNTNKRRSQRIRYSKLKQTKYDHFFDQDVFTFDSETESNEDSESSFNESPSQRFDSDQEEDGLSKTNALKVLSFISFILNS